jgi:hypothetical protein
MKKDFHFYCIGVLARAAGFCSDEALIIAYASQYVDSATESELIQLEGEAGAVNFSFEPVHTAYELLKPDQGMRSLSWAAQKRVWIPFHFIPPRPFDPRQPSFSFITEPGSPFADHLLELAAQEEHVLRRLCRIGVALHTYADSWAHKGFSGRINPDENEVENLEIYHPEKERWEPLPIENIVEDLMPEIGHAQALYFPDIPYQKWRCTLGSSKRPGGDDNPTSFLQAAGQIYDRLRHIRERDGRAPIDPIPWNDTSVDVVPWEDLRPLIYDQLRNRPVNTPGFVGRLINLEADLEERCRSWEKGFSHWFKPHSDFRSYDYAFGYDVSFHYDHEGWRRDALEGDTAWDAFMPKDWNRQGPYKTAKGLEFFWETLWVHFHRAALRQRHLVLELLP